MENQKLCPVCNMPMLYNSIGLSKNPKAPTYKCSNESCKMHYNINTNSWEPSKFRTGVWEKGQPVAEPVYQPVAQPMYQAPQPKPEQPNWDRINASKADEIKQMNAIKSACSLWQGREWTKQQIEETIDWLYKYKSKKTDKNEELGINEIPF